MQTNAKLTTMPLISYNTLMSRGGGKVVSALAFYSTITVRIPSLRSTIIILLNCLKRTKINKKRPGMAHLKT